MRRAPIRRHRRRRPRAEPEPARCSPPSRPSACAPRPSGWLGRWRAQAGGDEVARQTRSCRPGAPLLRRARGSARFSQRAVARIVSDTRPAFRRSPPGHPPGAARPAPARSRCGTRRLPVPAPSTGPPGSGCSSLQGVRGGARGRGSEDSLLRGLPGFWWSPRTPSGGWSPAPPPARVPGARLVITAALPRRGRHHRS